jgi:hypothetical protein
MDGASFPSVTGIGRMGGAVGERTSNCVRIDRSLVNVGWKEDQQQGNSSNKIVGFIIQVRWCRCVCFVCVCFESSFATDATITNESIRQVRRKNQANNTDKERGFNSILRREVKKSRLC